MSAGQIVYLPEKKKKRKKKFFGLSELLTRFKKKLYTTNMMYTICQFSSAFEFFFVARTLSCLVTLKRARQELQNKWCPVVVG